MHLSQEAIDRFAARGTEPAEAAGVRRHLLGCPECRERLRASPAYPERGRREAEIVAAMEERPGCPEPATKAAYASGMSGVLTSERCDAVTAHLRRCGACARDVRALQAVRDRAVGPDGTLAPETARRPGCLAALVGSLFGSR